jgi:hypothetical protein
MSLTNRNPPIRIAPHWRQIAGQARFASTACSARQRLPRRQGHTGLRYVELRGNLRRNIHDTIGDRKWPARSCLKGMAGKAITAPTMKVPVTTLNTKMMVIVPMLPRSEEMEFRASQ